MRVPRASQRGRIGINMTPMIDIVFLLVIFFLVSSHLVQQENGIELALPAAASGEDDVDVLTPRVTISVRDDGSLWLAGRDLPVAALAGVLGGLKREKGDGLEVRIRVGRELPYAAVEPILLACTEAGVWNVTWSVYREGGGP